jgi:CheY-like chemotaxis protein
VTASRNGVRVVAVVQDLFFAARFRETARLVGAALTTVDTPEALEGALQGDLPGLVILDLTTPGWDYARLFGVVEARAPAVPVLGFTTHALARQTQPLHGRCARVLTKETLTRELPEILKEGVTA